MPTSLESLRDNTTGRLTAEDIRFIAELLSREVTAPNMHSDAAGWHILPSGDAGTQTKTVIIRSIELVANGYGADKIMVQELQYKDSPPVAGQIQAIGEKFEVFPFEGHSYSSYDFFRSVLPLIGELEDESIHPNACFAYIAYLRKGYWLLAHQLRMSAGVTAVDVNNVDYAGGSST